MVWEGFGEIEGCSQYCRWRMGERMVEGVVWMEGMVGSGSMWIICATVLHN